MKRKTKIIATIGPATNDKEIMSAIFDKGVDIVRLNFSWGTHEDMKELISLVREVSKEKGISVPILQDLSGPRMILDSGHTVDNDKEIITEKDKKDLLFGIEHSVEYVALSFVSKADDIHNLRKIMVEQNVVIPIIAKIERKEALDNIHTICDIADGIMIARGDLGTAFPLEEVPLIEREIIKICKEKEKFVIVATEMLLSMTKSPVPTRAEVNDVATAVELGASAVMLSEETATGKYPVDTVNMMRKIILFSEEEKMTPHHIIK